jgi:hypothetical protein
MKKEFRKFMTKVIVMLTCIVAAYLLRRNFRRAFYILWTDDEHPDWEAIYRRWYKDKDLELLAKDGGKLKSFAKEAAEK